MKPYQKLLSPIILLCIILVFSQCEQPGDPEPKKEKAIANAQMANAANPYDAHGAAHNDFLDFFIANADLTQSEWDRDDWFPLFESYHASQGQAFTTEYEDYYNQFINVYEEADAFPCTNWPEDLCLCLPWLCDDIITGLPLLPLTLPNPGSGQSEYDRHIGFIEEAKFLESEIMQNDTLSEATREVYLKYYCYFRYSVGYWHNVINVNKEESPWYEYLDLNSGRECVSCDIIEADAAGGAIGALIAGPPGALAGAAAASAAVALEHLLKLL